MGSPGRPPKPSIVKALENNPGKRPIAVEVKFREGLSAKPPTWLSREGKKLWKHLVPQLLEIPGLLQLVDRTAMETLCESYAIWKQAVQTIREEGTTYAGVTKGGYEYITERPEVKIAAKHQKLMMEALAVFGFTPASRTRISIPQPAGDDGFDAL